MAEKGMFANSFEGIVLIAVTTALAVAGWFVRRVLTDSRRIDLLEQRQELQHKEVEVALTNLERATRTTESASLMATQNQSEILRMLQDIREGKV
ncbi:hypothetical protein QO034_13335 [Sedimentitalea sp. JM2-8]|uniref:Phage shock protein B n=1 Tax=Sedimentitalea xiamensis TaxID=3050037 RepID=A0ABT7FH40_9RHOB|nr:hypothetical protein [Sedimentitalea xiamensis]MDK3074099.1 hypothetical protein [Sedimentitalea xiamensis]